MVEYDMSDRELWKVNSLYTWKKPGGRFTYYYFKLKIKHDSGIK
jgi:hypothetical protein